MSPSCEQAQQSDTGMHVAGSGLHQPTAQSRIFERLFDVHSEAEDLSALSFWSAFAFGFSLETESLGGFETGLTGFAPQLFEQDQLSELCGCRRHG